jgi:hypothetical protein
MVCAAVFVLFGVAAGNVRAQEPPELPPLNRTVMDLDAYKAQVNQELPSPLPAGILSASDGPDWFSTVDVAAVAAAMADTPAPDQIAQDGPRTLARDIARNKYVKLDSSRGRIRYANRTRRFDWSTSSHTAVAESAAKTLVETAIADLGIPSVDAGGIFVATIQGQTYDAATSTADPPFDRERVVIAKRSVNGYPVFGSIVRGSVSNSGQHAHFMVDWPQFTLPSGPVLRDRQDVVDEIAARIDASEQGAAVDLSIELGYARAGDGYLPVAKAAFADPLSGEVAFVPIADVAPDVDLDGEPDSSDNCVERPNPGQEDVDGDGIGDLCDNCPEIWNPGQSDANGDGAGDLCEPSIPAVTSWRTAVAALCLLAAGTFVLARRRRAAD